MRVCVALILLLLPLTGSAQSAGSVEREIAAYQMATHTPGVVMGLIADGKVFYRRAFGVRKVGAADPVTPQTIFHMASVTKPFVSTAILQLADTGKVDLSAPLLRYLPDFRMSDRRLAQVTIEQVLAHTSGLPDVEDYHWDRPEFDDDALARYLATWRDAHLLFDPGERFAYSNLGYELLAAVIARVSGEPFERYMAAQVLAPLGMKSSTLLLSEVDPARLARPHELDDRGVPREAKVFPYNRVHAGSSTLYSCVDDMLRWLEFNVGDGAPLLSPKMFADQRRARAVIPYPQLPSNTRIGLGLLMFERNGEMVMGHSGSDDGFVSIALFVPSRRAGIVAMGNLLDDRAQPEFWAMALRVLDAQRGN